MNVDDRPARRALIALTTTTLLLLGSPPPASAGTAPPVTTLPMAETRVNLSFDRVPLADTLAELGRSAGIVITVRGPLVAAPVTARLVDVEAQHALRYLLRHHSYLLVEADAEGGAHGRHVEVVLLRSQVALATDAEAARTAASPEPAGLPDARPRSGPRPVHRLVDEMTHTAVAGASVADRRAALLRLVHDDRSGAVAPVLAAALEDPDDSVRLLALRHLAEQEGAPPLDRLVRMSREDRSSSVRREALALIAVATPGDARALLEDAMSDHDAAVRRQARSLLGRDQAEPAGPVRPPAPRPSYR